MHDCSQKDRIDNLEKVIHGKDGLKDTMVELKTVVKTLAESTQGLTTAVSGIKQTIDIQTAREAEKRYIDERLDQQNAETIKEVRIQKRWRIGMIITSTISIMALCVTVVTLFISMKS